MRHRRDGREVSGKRRTDHIDVAHVVDADAGQPVVQRAAEISAEGEHRIHHEGQPPIVPPDYEPRPTPAEQAPASGHRDPMATRLLIDDRAPVPQRRAARAHDQIAVVDLQAVDAVEGEAEHAGIGARREVEVILELPVARGEDGIDTGVEVVISDRVPGRHTDQPRARIVPHVVVDARIELTGPDGRHPRICPEPSDAHGRVRRRGTDDLRAAVQQERPVTAPGDELTVRSCLPAVLLERQRQPPPRVPRSSCQGRRHEAEGQDDPATPRARSGSTTDRCHLSCPRPRSGWSGS